MADHKAASASQWPGATAYGALNDTLSGGNKCKTQQTPPIKSLYYNHCGSSHTESDAAAASLSDSVVCGCKILSCNRNQ
eukprot:5019099-Amphidinium_carterae.1